MAPTRRSSGPGKEKQRPARKELNGGAWTAEEDQKLAEAVGIHGAKQWRIIAAKAGLNRCAKSCRLRWMNYVRPNMKRGNISDQEEDLISRLHKLLGNRWSLIAGRLPGRTGDEIKNYWNCHLSKKKFEQEAIIAEISAEERGPKSEQTGEENGESTSSEAQGTESRFDANDFFDFSNENPSTVEWITEFLEFGARS